MWVLNYRADGKTMTHLDGNVLAGPLSELFSVDMTVAVGRCAGCGDQSVLANAMVYESGPDIVVRCHHCDDVLMTLVQSPDDLRVEFRGIEMFRVAR
jgi:hypothetical protein